MNVFLDTNVLLDMFLARDDGSAADLFKQIADNSTYIVSVSDITVINTYYILEKISNKKNARQAVGILIKCCEINVGDSVTIQSAFNSDFTDFEDAVQYYCAKASDVELLVTNNIKDFQLSDIKIATASEALQFLFKS
ncbi:MAG: PIN domain-containing protein [Flavobacteriaceae bacterium]|nr:PIN domain-containing protein [Flavobacteriaceae bacterium]